MALLNIGAGASFRLSRNTITTMLTELATHHSDTIVDMDKEQGFRSSNRGLLNDALVILGASANAIHAGSVTLKTMRPGSSFRVNRKILRTMFTELFIALDAEDIVMVLTPSTVAPVPTAEGWTRTVNVSMQTTGGKVHTWLTDTYPSKVSIEDTSVAGTASITSTTLTIVAGVGSIEITGDVAAWLDTETDTLTIAALSIRSATVATKSSVETFTAV